jgi:hypothetical protein
MQLLRYQYTNQIKSCGLELDADGMLISFEEYYLLQKQKFLISCFLHPDRIVGTDGSTSYQAGRNTT